MGELGCGVGRGDRGWTLPRGSSLGVWQTGSLYCLYDQEETELSFSLEPNTVATRYRALALSSLPSQCAGRWVLVYPLNQWAGRSREKLGNQPKVTQLIKRSISKKKARSFLSIVLCDVAKVPFFRT